MTPSLNRDEVVKTLNELQNQEKTAQVFQVSKDTLKKHLTHWGIEVNFSGCKASLQARRKLEARNETFEVGETAMWVPFKPRPRCFGLPIGVMPIEVRVMSERSKSGHYVTEVINARLRAQLTKSTHVIQEHNLRKLNDSTVGGATT